MHSKTLEQSYINRRAELYVSQVPRLLYELDSTGISRQKEVTLSNTQNSPRRCAKCVDLKCRNKRLFIHNTRQKALDALANRQISAALSASDLGFDNFRYHAEPHPIIAQCPGINHAAKKYHLPFCEARSPQRTLSFADAFICSCVTINCGNNLVSSFP